MNGKRAEDETLMVQNSDAVSVLKRSRGEVKHVLVPPRWGMKVL